MITASEAVVGHIFNRVHGKGRTPTVLTEEIVGKIFTDNSEYALNDFEPIGIDPASLEMLGFYERGIKNGQAWHILWGEKMEFVFYLLDGYIRLQTIMGGFTINFEERIKHVHELQSLYFLITGKKLEHEIR